MTFAFVFPGQGSQSVGMLSSLSAVDPVVRATFDEASTALGYDLWQLTQAGPAERLNTTEFTQPALLAAGIATARLWARRGGGDPAVVAGHSLGEFTALVCAGALDFPTAAALVKFRGQVMQEAVPAGVGAMFAILGTMVALSSLRPGVDTVEDWITRPADLSLFWLVAETALVVLVPLGCALALRWSAWQTPWRRFRRQGRQRPAGSPPG